MTSRGGTRRREIRLAAAGVWLIVLASDGLTHACPDEVPAPNTSVRPDHPSPGVVNSLSEGGVVFRQIPLRSMGSDRGFAAPAPSRGAKLGLHGCRFPSELVAQISRARPLLSPPCEGGARGGGPESVECTREACLAQSIGEVDGGRAASPACQAGHFRTSSWANDQDSDAAEAWRPTPPAPPFTRGGNLSATARMREQERSFGRRLCKPVNPNFAPRHPHPIPLPVGARATTDR